MSEKLDKRLKKIKLLISDVDGVFTNGAFYINGESKEYKKFNAQDGLGIRMLESINFPFAIISGRESQSTSYRMKELGVTEDIYQGDLNKVDKYSKIKDKYGLENDQIAYIGDDLVDLPLLKKVGAGFCVPNATKDVKEKADLITDKSGGDGAVREVIDVILRGQNKYESAVQKLLEQE